MLKLWIVRRSCEICRLLWILVTSGLNGYFKLASSGNGKSMDKPKLIVPIQEKTGVPRFEKKRRNIFNFVDQHIVKQIE
ncbi:unnamed protein product [Caenorhabditis angaria]|uniref:Uncharacterized protein n=1 Tax=Caenorhabditis angaria TaxID=860376 RepID=A0A9P1IWD6_9PELO|nr:unnamed protein product [Caenorhabditis angaria]